MAVAAATFGVVFGGGATSSHGERPRAAVQFDYSPPPLPSVQEVTTTTEAGGGVAPEPEPPPTTPAPVPPPPPRVWPSSYQPCGGVDYPPCWVVERESGGDYNAVSPPSFCGGRGCYGKWQFSGEWACKLGLPCDLRLATPEQQDEAARILWNGGRGCSNWAAC